MTAVRSIIASQLLQNLDDSRKAESEVCGNNKPVKQQGDDTALLLILFPVIGSVLSLRRDKAARREPRALASTYSDHSHLIVCAAAQARAKRPMTTHHRSTDGTGLGRRENAEHRFYGGALVFSSPFSFSWAVGALRRSSRGSSAFSSSFLFSFK